MSMTCLVLSSIEQDLDRFINWCKGNALTVNVKITKYVCFGLKSQTRRIQMNASNVTQHRKRYPSGGNGNKL